MRWCNGRRRICNEVRVELSCAGRVPGRFQAGPAAVPGSRGAVVSAAVDAVGYLAGVLTTAAFVPQMWLTLRTRDVSGISLAMYSLFTLGIALWLAYGIALRAWPVIVPNVITLVLALAIVCIKLRVERRRR